MTRELIIPFNAKNVSEKRKANLKWMTMPITQTEADYIDFSWNVASRPQLLKIRRKASGWRLRYEALGDVRKKINQLPI